MKTLIIGTGNKAKVQQLKGALASLNLEVIGLPENQSLPEVVEDGQTAQQNAKKKARAYSQALGQIVLSMDNALYLDGLRPEEQPGINVRRIPGSTGRPSDDELRAYYSELISSLGGQVNGYWEFAICVANSEGVTKETTIISPRLFVANSSPNVVAGYPLESLQKEPESGKYISDMTQEEQNQFWQKMIGTELCHFVGGALQEP